ncbi:uncharacterized protein K441DRAFT_677154 [Cenococcum geophilum 1.58]|uniref:uncharacterized protein n=1 Tax=Cenococcum geophilum 1.58 TaxID=794803 RepID=UPI00358FDA57|nr:hypothetical protein K441DRAFT_677154 [Cenococcum geophilum 1.58]
MTRPIELKDPDDPRQIMAYIERNARRSTSAILNKLLKSMPTPLRDVNLRPSERAFIADSPCNNCQAQAGPFKDCVILVGYDDFTKKCCTNCQWQLYTAKTPTSNIAKIQLDRAHNSRVVKSRQQICPLNAFIHGADTALEYQEATASDSRISAEGTLEGDVCILGDLVLPPLTTASSEIQEIVKDLLPHLEMLQNRDMTKNGETADRTNGCISMIMGTAYSSTTLVYDQVHRRDPESHGSTIYPPYVRQAHKEWTRQISESSEAKVEVVYGRKATDAILTDPEVRTTPLPLWGQYSGMILILIHESNFRNSQSQYEFRKIMVCAFHPQRLFTDPADGVFACHQEQALSVAAAMARVYHIPNYYKKKLWPLVQPASTQRHLDAILQRYPAQAQAIEFSKQFQNVQTGNSEDELEMGTKTSVWEQFFNQTPHSNKMLFELLPAAIQAITQSSQNYRDPSEFPPPVLIWWQGQKQILFYDIKVEGLEDILSVLRKCQRTATGLTPASISSLPGVLKVLMEIQKQALEQEIGIKSPQHEKGSYVHSRFDGQDVSAKCAACGEPARFVKNPTYSVNRPGHFVVINKRRCRACGKRAHLFPTHEPYTYDTTLHSTAPKIEMGAKMGNMLQKRHNLTQLQPVESVCLRCGDQTELAGGENVYIDLEPRWTLGNARPLYVERRPICLTCRNSHRTSDRFIQRTRPFHQSSLRLSQGSLMTTGDIQLPSLLICWIIGHHQDECTGGKVNLGYAKKAVLEWQERLLLTQLVTAT